MATFIKMEDDITETFDCTMHLGTKTNSTADTVKLPLGKQTMPITLVYHAPLTIVGSRIGKIIKELQQHLRNSGDYWKHKKMTHGA